jgi:hypothetical protein
MSASSVEHRPAAEPVTCGEDVLVLLNDGANILTAIDVFANLPVAVSSECDTVTTSY